MMMFFWLVPVLLVVWLLVDRPRRSGERQLDEEQILRTRLARGEITVEEFDRIRQHLGQETGTVAGTGGARKQTWLLFGAGAIAVVLLLWGIAQWGFTGRAGFMGWGPGMMMGGSMAGMHASMMGGGGAEQLPQTSIPQDAPRHELTVGIREWAMNPPTLTAKKGEHVQLTVRNDGTMPHNFAIPGLGVRLTNIAPGTSRQIDLHADKAGTFAYLCDIPGHARAGQQGQLVVQ